MGVNISLSAVFSPLLSDLCMHNVSNNPEKKEDVSLLFAPVCAAHRPG